MTLGLGANPNPNPNPNLREMRPDHAEATAQRPAEGTRHGLVNRAVRRERLRGRQARQGRLA